MSDPENCICPQDYVKPRCPVHDPDGTFYAMPDGSALADGATRYGFDWGPMKVERVAHIEGRGYALEVRTDHCSMQIYVSEKGRKIEPQPVRARAAFDEEGQNG